MLTGLSTINVELTSRCNKKCWCCGRRKIEQQYPDLAASWADMPFPLVRKIARQLPPGVVVQLHNNGEPTLYPRLGEAIKLFENQITAFDTNGKLLVHRADEIIGRLDTLTVSVVQDDPEAPGQYNVLTKFLALKKKRKPLVVLRMLGNVEEEQYDFKDVIKVNRMLHSPMGSFDYTGSPTRPEIGVCLEILHHPAIDRHGRMSVCVRFDPEAKGVMGDIHNNTLRQIWNGAKRQRWLKWHLRNRRDKVPLCKTCEYWGIPTGA